MGEVNAQGNLSNSENRDETLQNTTEHHISSGTALFVKLNNFQRIKNILIFKKKLNRVSRDMYNDLSSVHFIKQCETRMGSIKWRSSQISLTLSTAEYDIFSSTTRSAMKKVDKQCL